mmetsp:Transcript_9703/g.23713  ORF Transcript_9703/g.23713 Transcript_9703/m.23713 type:complete len:214 (-) Transcript_9703:711-1352(-)
MIPDIVAIIVVLVTRNPANEILSNWHPPPVKSNDAGNFCIPYVRLANIIVGFDFQNALRKKVQGDQTPMVDASATAQKELLHEGVLVAVVLIHVVRGSIVASPEKRAVDNRCKRPLHSFEAEVVFRAAILLGRHQQRRYSPRLETAKISDDIRWCQFPFGVVVVCVCALLSMLRCFSPLLDLHQFFRQQANVDPLGRRDDCHRIDGILILFGK